MLNETVVSKYFEDLAKHVSDFKFQDCTIWNSDETGFNFEHSPVRVDAEKGIKSDVSKTSQKSSNLTVMTCINGAGSAMPSLIITKGKTVKSIQGYKTSDAPAGTVLTFQDKGWITDDIGEKWFDEVFLKYCGPTRPQLLIFDGHSSHESLAITKRAVEENITLLSLPPHYLQPLDRTVFGPLKKAYNEQCPNFMSEHPLHVVNKWSFPALFSNAWDAALTISNIKSGFASCGICPVNKDAVPFAAFRPSSPTDVAFTNDTSNREEPIGDSTANQVYSTADNSVALEGLSYTEPVLSTDVDISSTAITSDSVEEMALPVLDLSDPAQLLDFITSGEIFVEPQPFHENDTNDISLMEIDCSNNPSTSDLIESAFMPPKLKSRPNHDRTERPVKKNKSYSAYK